MREALRQAISPDGVDLASWHSETDDFALDVQLLVGPLEGPGEESFDLTVCTPGWLLERTRKDGVVSGYHTLIMETFNFPMLYDYREKRVSACDGESWDEVARKLSRLGSWEFEDYRG